MSGASDVVCGSGLSGTAEGVEETKSGHIVLPVVIPDTASMVDSSIALVLEEKGCKVGTDLPGDGGKVAGDAPQQEPSAWERVFRKFPMDM